MKKVLKWIGGIFLSLFLLFVLVAIFSDPVSPEEKRKRDKASAEQAARIKLLESQSDSLTRANELAEEIAKKQEDECLTAYVSAERALKTSLKDPDSYEEIEHKSFIVKPEPGEKTYAQVVISYRAKNSFGGFVVNKRFFNFDKALNLFDTFEQ